MPRRYEPRYYKLIGTLVVQIDDMWEWARTYKYDSPVRQEEIAGALVSTIFLGLDHNVYSPLTVNNPEPHVFETMIFPTDIWNYYQTRCSTYEQALAMHRTACDLVRKTQRQLPVVQQEES